MTLEIITKILIVTVGVVIARFAFDAIVLGSRRKLYLKAYNEGLTDGSTAYQEKLKAMLGGKPPLLGEGYRDHAMAKVCACCGSRCIHCAKKDAEAIEDLKTKAEKRIRRAPSGRFR